MACGVHLGILLICLVQAEHARCSWSQQAPGSQRRDSDGYAGFPRQDGGAQRLGSLQNKLRQPPVPAASAHGRRFAPQNGASGGLSRGLSTGDSAQTSTSREQTNWQGVKVQKLPPAQHPDWFTPISSGSSINHFSGKKATSQDHLNQYLFGNGVSPSKRYMSMSDSQLSAQRPHGSAAEPPRAVGADASTEGQTLACGLGRRVASRRHYGSFKPSRFPPPPNERPRQIPSQRNPHQSSKPSSNTAFNCASSPPDWLKRQSAANKNPNKPGRLSSSSAGTSAGRGPWTNGNPAASRTFSIPQQLGGYAIRRPTGSSDQQETRVLKQPASYKPRGQRVRWYTVKLH